MKDKILVEIDRVFEIEMRVEVIERDEGGRKKIKKRTVDLKNTGGNFLEFRDSWVAVEEEQVQMRQRRNSEDETEIEEEEIQRKRKRQRNNSKSKKQDDNIHEMEIRALKRLEKHKFKFRV